MILIVTFLFAVYYEFCFRLSLLIEWALCFRGNILLPFIPRPLKNEAENLPSIL